MERLGIKISLLIIAVTSVVYWAQPPHDTGAPLLAAASGLWVFLAFAAFRWERAEDWTYRFSSFLGVSLATVEGISALLALQDRAGLFPMALLHGAAFILAVIGRYQKVGSRRPRRELH